MSALLLVVLLNAASALFMTGIIWFVQIVHYPLFLLVGRSRFAAYHQGHARRTGYVVAPLMVAELTAALVMLFMTVPPQLISLVWVNAALVAAIWLSTFTMQVPFHRTLTSSYDEILIAKLVRSNAIRVVLWTARTRVSLVLIFEIVR